MGFYSGRLLSGYEAILCLVPEGGSIIKSQFFIKNDVSECIDFHSARCRVPVECAVVGVRVPMVIDVFPVVWGRIFIKVECL